ncbi:MAG: DUF938 domain-containing protein [SAR324 cluster bacterium]|nr:DUF938 domain-containing protein [SAR324 cluster bacterium]
MKIQRPHVARNRDHVLAVLKEVLPPRGEVLEVASGSGEHAAYYAAQFPDLTWQPSDCNPKALASIGAWVEDANLPNLRAPLVLDLLRPAQAPTRANAVLNMNMIHISPWTVCEGLLALAGRVLGPGEPLILYGPFFVAGRDTAPSNLEFDEFLRSRNPAWGIRQLEQVAQAAAAQGLALERTVDMPSNNLSLIFRKE